MSTPARDRVAGWAVHTATTAVGVLGWLFAQHVSFGIVEHTHLVANGHLDAHHHHYAGPVAVVAAGVLGLALLLLFGHHLRASSAGTSDDLSRRSAAGGEAATGAGLRRHVLLAASGFVAVETLEQARAGDPTPFAQLAGLLAVGVAVQVGIAAAARHVSGHLVDGTVALAVRFIRPQPNRLPTHRRVTPAPGDHNPQAQAAPAPTRGRAPPHRGTTFQPVSTTAVARCPATLSW